MGLFSDAARELRGRTAITNPRNPAYWLSKLLGGEATASGIRVTPELALKIGAVYASCRNLAEDIGTLPLPVYRHVGESGRAKDREHPVHRILNVRGNAEMSAADVRQTIQGHAALRGTGWAEIEFTGRGVSGLWPLQPHRMKLVRNGVNGVRVNDAPAGQLLYLYRLPDGQLKTFHPDRIFRLPGWGGDGLEGHSIVRLAASSIALAAAAQEFAERNFSNDARPGVVLKHKGTLSDDAYRHLLESWAEAHQGLERSQQVAILEDGVEIDQIPISAADAQLLGSRLFQHRDIGNFFRMPPDKLQDYERATFTNVEHSDLVYVKYTLRAWFVRWEQQIRLSLLTDTHFAEHVAEGLLRGDSKSRGEFYHSLRQDGAITANQIAERENLPPIEGPAGDELWIPLNMTPSSAFDENGMTMKDRYAIAASMVRSGYDYAETLKVLGLPAIKHTGHVPVTVQLPEIVANKLVGQTDESE